MKEKFIRDLVREFVEKHDYTLVKGFSYDDRIICVEKIYSSSRIIIDIVDADVLSKEAISERLENIQKFKNSLNSSNLFVELFVFDSVLPEDKLSIIADAGRMKNISVSISEKTVIKHYRFPLYDLGIFNAVKNFLQSFNNEESEPYDIEELNNIKKEETKIELKVKIPIITYSLIAINLLVYVAVSIYSTVTGNSFNESLIIFGAKDNLLILNGELWRFLTPMFLHANIVHLLVNCYSLYIVGSSVERIFGRWQVISVYLLAGIAGNLASFVFSANPGVGASGAIFGLLGALLFFGFMKPKIFKKYFGYNILIIIVINIAYGLSTSGIDNFAHIGGLVGGFIVSGFIVKSISKKWYFNRLLYLLLTIAIMFLGVFAGSVNKLNHSISENYKLDKLIADQDWVNAERKAEAILESDPIPSIKSSAMWSLSLVEIMSEKPDEAIVHAKELVEIDPINGHYLLGVIYYDMKQYDLAKQELNTAKSLGDTREYIDEILSKINSAEK